MAFRNRTPVSVTPAHPMKGEKTLTENNPEKTGKGSMMMIVSTQCGVNATYDAMVNIKPNRPILH